MLIRMLAADSLEDSGYRVLEAADAAEALRILEEHDEVSVLFTDVNMPGSVDGVELARMVHRRWPDLRIIVTSGRDRPPVPDDSLFLPKPYRPREVAHVIEELIRAA